MLCIADGFLCVGGVTCSAFFAVCVCSLVVAYMYLTELTEPCPVDIPQLPLESYTHRVANLVVEIPKIPSSKDDSSIMQGQ